MIRALSLLTLIMGIFTPSAFAQTIAANGALKNDTSYYWIFNGSTSEQANCQNACYAVLNPKGEQWVNLKTATAWIDLEYDICEQVNYSADGKAMCQNYLGHVGVVFSGNIDAKIGNTDKGSAKIVRNSQVFNLQFTPNVPPVSEIIPIPTQYDKAPFRGVNIAAAEFNSDSGNIDWIIQDAFPNKKDLSYFGKYGMNTYRMPIRWSYAQPVLNGALNDAYVNQLYQSVKLYLEAGHNVIIDLHSYMHFESDPRKDPLNSSQIVTEQQLVDFWDKLSTKFKDLAVAYPDSQRKNQLIFDLMNEPTDDISASATLKRYNGVLSMLRQKGIHNLVLLEGPHYSGMHSWITRKDSENKSNAEVFTPENIKDSANNYAINVHQYFDHNFSGTNLQCTGYPISEIQQFIEWSKQTKQKFMVTELGGADQGNCQPYILDFLNLLHQSETNYGSSEGGLLGWTLWSGGRYWGAYMLSVYLGGGAQQLPQTLLNAGLLKYEQSAM